MRVLIAGCGDVGQELALTLMKNGHIVYTLKRRPWQPPHGVHTLYADLTKPESLNDLPMVDTVFYLAAPGKSDRENYTKTYVQGQTFLKEALLQQNIPPQQWFFSSSTSVYGQCGGVWVNEDSPTNPENWRGQTMLDAEKICRTMPWPSTIVRFSGIYGPGRNYLIWRAADGWQVPADPPRYSNRIHRNDAAAVLQHLMTLPNLDSCYLASDTTPAPLHEILSWLRQQMAIPSQDHKTPATTSSFFAGANKRCSNKRLMSTGFRFQYPDYKTGYGEIIREGRNPNAKG